MAALARDARPFLIGISSLFSAYSEEALETARTVKRFLPDCPIIMGGHHPTALPEPVLACEAVDYIIRGEGEVAMPLLARAVANDASEDELAAIPGIGFCRKNGQHVIQPPAVIKDLNNVPLPAVHHVHSTYYNRKNKKAMVVTASRGCPMTCSYCAFGAGALMPYRRRTICHIMAEIDQAAKTGQVGFIDFEDENLSLDKPWFMGLLNEIRFRFSGEEVELRAMNGLYPPALDEEIVAAMAEAGFKTLNLSVGSVHPAQLARFKRPDVTAAFESALAWAEKYNMDAVGYIIAGAPNQTAKDSLADLLYLAGQRVLAGLSIFYPAPGSADYDRCQKDGLLPASFSLMRATAFPVSHTTSRLQSVTLLRLARILNFIKSIKDEDIPLPSPIPFDPSMDGKMTGNRRQAGLSLLQWFLADGKIRGITSQGEIFEHFTDITLARRFIQHLDISSVKGKNIG